MDRKGKAVDLWLLPEVWEKGGGVDPLSRVRYLTLTSRTQVLNVFVPTHVIAYSDRIFFMRSTTATEIIKSTKTLK